MWLNEADRQELIRRVTKNFHTFGGGKVNPDNPIILRGENMKKCRWIEDEGNNWDTGCGKSWEFHYDGPEENEVKYCPFCGKLVEAKYIVRLNS